LERMLPEDSDLPVTYVLRDINVLWEALGVGAPNM
jgi:hypothetical protein